VTSATSDNPLGDADVRDLSIVELYEHW
jgi:hypothetical protein